MHGSFRSTEQGSVARGQRSWQLLRAELWPESRSTASPEWKQASSCPAVKTERVWVFVGSSGVTMETGCFEDFQSTNHVTKWREHWAVLHHVPTGSGSVSNWIHSSDWPEVQQIIQQQHKQTSETWDRNTAAVWILRIISKRERSLHTTQHIVHVTAPHAGTCCHTLHLVATCLTLAAHCGTC